MHQGKQNRCEQRNVYMCCLFQC